MFLYDKPKWLICAFLLETNKMSENGDVYPVPHEKRMIMIEVEREPTWELKLKEISPKITAMRDFFYDKLQDQFS
jgi:hypothetical protein